MVAGTYWPLVTELGPYQIPPDIGEPFSESIMVVPAAFAQIAKVPLAPALAGECMVMVIGMLVLLHP